MTKETYPQWSKSFDTSYELFTTQNFLNSCFECTIEYERHRKTKKYSHLIGLFSIRRKLKI